MGTRNCSGELARRILVALLFAFLCTSLARSLSAQTLISVSPTQLNFGDVQAGIKSAAMSVTVTNIGNVETNVSASATPYEFALLNPTQFKLVPGASNSFKLQFLPDLLQMFTGTLTINASGQPQPVLVPLSGTATNPVEFSNSTIEFEMEGVGLLNPNVTVNVKNVGMMPFVEYNATATPPFSIQGANFTSIPRDQASLTQLGFMPTAAGPVTGTLSIYLENVLTPFTATLTGTGVDPGAVFVVTPSSMNFPNVPLGSTSAGQTFTTKNAGTGTDTIESIFVPAPWQLTNLELNGQTVAEPVVVPPGSSVTGNITYFGSGTGTPTGSLNIVYQWTPASGIDLTGSTVSVAPLAVTTFNPDLMTQGAAYQAQLTAAGGTGTYTWKLEQGSTLPTGLTLSSSGLISGTVSSTFALGSYPFTAEVKDQSIPVQEASREFAAIVDVPTGAKCDNVVEDQPDFPQDPLIALTDLGTGTYVGTDGLTYEGGLYPDGSNVDPLEHDSAGVALAKAIQPLDAEGNPDPNGVYALMSIGISSTQQEWYEVQQLGNADPEKNTHLVLVNGAVPGVQAGSDSDRACSDMSGWANPTDFYWPFIANVVTAQNGVTADQVVSIWFEDIIADAPANVISVEKDAYECVAQNVLTYFKNVKLMFFSSSLYTGYSNGLSKLDPEPYAYQAGFAMQGTIADQINGNIPQTPWLGWASYNWTNGLYGRDDGLTWSCQDAKANGIHPSLVVGREKVGSLLLDYFKTADVTAPWFDAPGANTAKKQAPIAK
jgi:hypothetical protein